MKRPKTYNVTFTKNTDGSVSVGDAFVFRKYNQHRRDLLPLSKTESKAMVRNLAESV